jgi:3-oxoacyl-[acyl-carrier protein] reductase
MTPNGLQGRVAVVTGGGRGIGLAIARRLAADGARLSLWDADADALEEAARDFSGGAHTAVVDVTDEATIAAGLEATRTGLGEVDILINNAGIAGPTFTTWDYPVEEWRRVIEIDLTGVFLCSRALVGGMMERGWGRIVNIASIAGKEGNPQAPAYSAAKAGVIGLTKSLGKETVSTGVLVNCVAPAAVETEILQQVSSDFVDFMRSKIPMGRLGRVEEVAALVAWLASDECSFSTGAVYDISGGRATY